MMISWKEVQTLIKSELKEMGKEIDVCKESRLIEDLELDSIALMDLFCKIEEQFGVDFTDLEDFGNRFNVCVSLCEVINELVEKKHFEDTKL